MLSQADLSSPPSPWSTSMRQALLRALTFSTAAVLAAPVARAQQRPMTPEDVLAIRSVSDPQISPDGKWVAYVVSRTEMKENAVDSDIYLVPTSCGSPNGLCEPLRLTTSKKADTSPRWSPDGRMLAFLSTRDEKSQIY